MPNVDITDWRKQEKSRQEKLNAKLEQKRKSNEARRQRNALPAYEFKIAEPARKNSAARSDESKASVSPAAVQLRRELRKLKQEGKIGAKAEINISKPKLKKKHHKKPQQTSKPTSSISTKSAAPPQAIESSTPVRSEGRRQIVNSRQVERKIPPQDRQIQLVQIPRAEVLQAAPKVTSSEKRFPCGKGKCKAMLLVSEIAEHNRKSHHPRKAKGKLTITHIFPFELLPKSHDSWKESIEDRFGLKRVERWNSLTKYRDESRITQWELIGDIQKCEGGLKAWDGYVAIFYENATKVVIDCIWSGNAIYILPKDGWRDMISLTKAELRSECDEKPIRHSGAWADRLTRAIFS